MGVKAKKGKGGCPLEAGNVLLKILDVVEANSDYGPMGEFLFKVHEGEHEGEKFNQRFSLVVSSNSYLGALIQAIDGILTDQEEYDMSKYEGSVVGAVIGVNPKSKTPRNRIIGFYPPGKPGPKAKDKEKEEEDVPI